MDALVQQGLEGQHGLKLLRWIGSGGFAELWEAHEPANMCPAR